MTSDPPVSPFPTSPTSGLRLAACVCLTRDDGRLLAVTRRINPRLLCFPGGKVDPGETPLQAAVRELFEETQAQVPPLALEQVFAGPCGHDNGNTIPYEVVAFHATWNSAWGPIRLREANILPMWVALEEFMARSVADMSDYNRQVLETLRDRLPASSRMFWPAL